MFHARRFSCFIISVFCVGAFALSGCNPAAKAPDDGPNATSKAEGGKNAQTILDQMAAAYRDAKSYEDAATLSFTFQREGKPEGGGFPYSTAFVRPNKIRLQCYGAVVVCDGKEMHASIGNLNSQVLSVPAPAKINEESLMSDPVLASALNEGGPAGAPLMPALLTNPKLLEEFMEGAEPPELLEPEKVEDQWCDRVAIEFKAKPAAAKSADPKSPDANPADKTLEDSGPTPVGKYVFSIDRQTHVLRQLDFPLHPGLRKDYEGRGAKDIQLVAKFDGARLNQPIKDAAQAFAFEMPAAAKPVKRFVMIDPPPAPSELMGKRIGDFVFTDADGKKITRDSLAGKTVLLEFWFAGCEPCAQLMPLLSRVRDKFKDDDKFAFYAVNIEGSSPKIDDLKKAIKDWNADLPVARDLDNQTKLVFGQEAFPFFMILGPDGKVQEFEAGMNPNLPVELPETLKKIAAGEDTFDNVKKRYATALLNYNETLRLANEGESTLHELPKVDIAAHGEPEKLKLTKLWKAADLKGIAGNLLLVPQVEGSPDKGQKIFVLDGWRTVAELDAAGKLVARHDLLIPQDAVVSFLRTAVDGEGKRYYVGFANNMPQFFLFDDKWNLLVSYPEGERVGIADVQLADLEGKGQLQILVGYWDAVGVQGVSLAGKRLWSNRVMQNVLRLGVSAKSVAKPAETTEKKESAEKTEPVEKTALAEKKEPDEVKDAGEEKESGEKKEGGEKKETSEIKVASEPEKDSPKSGQRIVYCVNGSEGIGTLDFEGKSGQPINSPGVALEWLVSEDLDGNGQNKLCVLSAHDPKATIAIGLDEHNHEQWSYPMIKGIPQKPVERIVAGKFADGRGAWVLAGPDGSLHLLASDGKLIDRFNYGADLTGVALTAVDGKTVLLISSTQGLEAWEVHSPKGE